MSLDSDSARDSELSATAGKMGANLEVFKFATYLFIPLFAMLHFGDPNWYEHHVQPYKEKLWPAYEETHKPPKTSSELHAELQRLRDERLGRKPVAEAAKPSPSPVLSNIPTNRQDPFAWAHEGDKRLV